MKSNLLVFVIFILLFSCEKPKVRKPIVHNSSTSYFEESISINKAINTREEEAFKQIMTSDTIHKYIASPFGFWYFYNTKKTKEKTSAKSGNQVIINYEIRDLDNKILLDKFELGSSNQKNKEDKFLKIDSEDFLLGLQHGIKLMKEGEEITFLMPSNLAFGATGLKGKVAPNQPLIINVKLKRIIK